MLSARLLPVISNSDAHFIYDCIGFIEISIIFFMFVDHITELQVKYATHVANVLSHLKFYMHN